MNVLGNKIRTVRESRNISQKELAKDLCRENVIQTIELKNRCDSHAVFTAICSRLDLKVEECLEYTDEQKLLVLLEQIEKKCNYFKHKEAYDMLEDYELGEVQQNILIMSQYYYYMGITTLVGAGNTSLAVTYFNQGIEYGDNLNIYTILSVSGLGSTYEGVAEMVKAEAYHNRALELLEQYFGEPVSIMYKIYYNAARFYSGMKAYQKAIQICKRAITLDEERGTFHHLDILYYELGFNKYMSGESALLEYKMAYYLAKHLNNRHVLHVIIEDAKRYQLSLQVDEEGVI